MIALSHDWGLADGWAGMIGGLGVTDGTDFVSFSAVIFVFGGSLSETVSYSGVSVSPEKIICGFTSDCAFISPITAFFIGLAGKSPTSAFRGYTAAHNATQAIMPIPTIISFFNIPSLFSNRHYHRQREIATHISLKLLKCRININ